MCQLEMLVFEIGNVFRSLHEVYTIKRDGTGTVVICLIGDIERICGTTRDVLSNVEQ
jgi:hypothetical protein